MNSQDIARILLSLFIMSVTALLYLLMDLRYRFAALFQHSYDGFFCMALIWTGISLSLLLLSLSHVRRGILLISEKYNSLFRSLIFFLSNKFVVLIIIICSAATFLVGAWWKYSFIERTELSSNFADMLPLILSACKELLAGNNPYTYHNVPWELPLTFLPGLWLPYYIPYLMNVDIRWVTVTIAIIIPVVLSIAGCMGFRRLAHSTWEFRSIFLLITCGAIVFFSLQLSLVSFSGIAHTSPLWLWVVLLAVFLLFDKAYLASILLAIALVSRQTTIIYLFPALVYFFRIYGLKKTFLLASIIISVVAVICLPFALNNLDMFLFAPVRHYNEMASHWMKVGAQGHVALNIGYAYIVNLSFGESALGLLRSVLFLVSTIWTSVLVRDKPSLFLVMAGNGILFSLFMPVSWHYVFFPPLFLLPFAALATLLNRNTFSSSKDRQVY